MNNSKQNLILAARGHNSIHAVCAALKSSLEDCEYCGKPAFKTNGKSELICENLANFGVCERKDRPRVVNLEPKQGNNELCKCGSNKKFKKCCKYK